MGGALRGVGGRGGIVGRKWDAVFLRAPSPHARLLAFSVVSSSVLLHCAEISTKRKKIYIINK